MTNIELADKIAGLPPVRIVWNLVFVVIFLTFPILLFAGYQQFKKQARLTHEVQEGISKVLGTPLNSVSIQVVSNSSSQNDMGIINYIVKDIKRVFSFRSGKSFQSLILAILTTIFLMWYAHKNSLKRRKILLRNFKLEDLKSAPQCSIQRTERLSGLFKKREKLNNWTGSIFEVREQKNVYVIFNESPFKVFERMLSKTRGYRVGVLLNYEDHYFFYCSSWIPNFDFGEED